MMGIKIELPGDDDLAPATARLNGETFALYDDLGRLKFDLSFADIDVLFGIAWARRGRPTLASPVIRHKDGDPLNNDPDNLEVVPFRDTPPPMVTTWGKRRLEFFPGAKMMYVFTKDRSRVIVGLTLEEMKEWVGWMESAIRASQEKED